MTPLEIYWIVQRNLTGYFNELNSPFSSEDSLKDEFNKLMKAFDLLLPMTMSLGSDLLDLVYGIDKAVNDMDEAAISESWGAISELIADHLGLFSDPETETVH